MTTIRDLLAAMADAWAQEAQDLQAALEAAETALRRIP